MPMTIVKDKILAGFKNRKGVRLHILFLWFRFNLDIMAPKLIALLVLWNSYSGNDTYNDHFKLFRQK